MQIIRFFKNYWFSILMALFFVVTTLYFIVVFMSPRYDLQRRGFIPCTEKLAAELETCNKSITCTLEAILTDNMCNAKVILQGFNLWVSGKQSTPWNNYIFEPELPPLSNDDNAEIEEFYKANPNLVEDMSQLKKMNKELEQND